MPTQQELLARITELEHDLRQVKKQKRYGLVWEDKPEDVVERCKKELPVLVEDESRRINDSQEDLTHILIEWDNYQVLSVLAYTHEKKVDVIYIDPPYNTGNNDFIYNDSYVDREDSFRHSKWLSFMEKRLRLAKDLLKDTGIIFISIDDNEISQLKLLCDASFGSENYVGTIVVQSNPRWSQSSKHLADVHEYLLCYAWRIDELKLRGEQKNEASVAEYNLSDESWNYRLLWLRQRWGAWKRSDRPNMYYPIYIDPLTGSCSLKEDVRHYKVSLPLRPTWEEGRWTWSKKKVEGELKRLIGKRVSRSDSEFWDVFRKDFLLNESWVEKSTKTKTIWNEKELNYQNGRTTLKQVLNSDWFDYPKPLDLIKKVLRLVDSSLVLDFFAWSGTTGHAVLELNKEDGGNRQFILCTNNENKIAEEVTYPRIHNVIKGYSDVEGIPANLRYYRTDFIGADKSIDDLRYKFMGRCTEMLQIKENCFTEHFAPLTVSEGWKPIDQPDYFQVFENSEKILAILYHPYEIERLRTLVQSNEKPVVAYIFSMWWEIFEEELSHFSDSIRIETIPDGILKTYKKIFGF